MPSKNYNEPVVLRSAEDVNHLINASGLARGSVLIVIIALGGIFIDAYDFTSLGIGVVQMKTLFHLTAFGVGSVTAMMAFGALLGAMYGGYLTDRVGRLKMFLLDLILLVVAAIGAAVSVNVVMLLVFRFLMGLGVGLDFPVALSFIAEYVSEQRKAAAVNLWLLAWYVATIFTGLVVLPFYLGGAGSNLWRIAVGFGAVPALIILVLRYRYMQESPLWAARTLGLASAARIIERSYGIKVVVSEDNQTPRTQPPTLRDIFEKKYRTSTIVVTVIAIAQSLEYFAIGFNIPSIVVKIFGGGFGSAIAGLVVFNIVGITASLTLVKLVRAAGQRRIGIVGFCIVIFSLLCLWADGHQLSVPVLAVLMALFIFGHSIGPAPMSMSVASLVYPTRIRGTGNGWAQSMVRVGSICGFYLYPILSATVGFHTTMLIVAIAPVVGLGAALFLTSEPAWIDADIGTDFSGVAGEEVKPASIPILRE